MLFQPHSVEAKFDASFVGVHLSIGRCMAWSMFRHGSFPHLVRVAYGFSMPGVRKIRDASVTSGIVVLVVAVLMLAAWAGIQDIRSAAAITHASPSTLVDNQKMSTSDRVRLIDIAMLPARVMTSELGKIVAHLSSSVEARNTEYSSPQARLRAPPQPLL
jgi:hypothetical protein